MLVKSEGQQQFNSTGTRTERERLNKSVQLLLFWLFLVVAVVVVVFSKSKKKKGKLILIRTTFGFQSCLTCIFSRQSFSRRVPLILMKSSFHWVDSERIISSQRARAFYKNGKIEEYSNGQEILPRAGEIKQIKKFDEAE